MTGVMIAPTRSAGGTAVNSSTLFSQNKVTMVNIWATTCGPCVEEMPELEKLNKEWAKKGGAVVGLVDDVPLDLGTDLKQYKERMEEYLSQAE